MTTDTQKKTTTNTMKASATTGGDSKPKPVKTFRRGAIAASVWQRQTGTGFPYFDFSLSRSWKSTSSGKEGYSTNYFPQNAEALGEVIREASDWIVEQMAGTDASDSQPLSDVRRAA